MARLNISIPDVLRASMDGLNCNWSAIAQEAFENVVKVEQLKNEGNDTEAGLARLRASKQANSDREQGDGFAHGRNWALEYASYDGLKELVGIFESAKKNPAKHDEAVTCIKQHIVGWRISLQDTPPSDPSDVSNAYAVGYLDGVVDVFYKV